MTIQAHYFPSPNGRKVSIALEEMGLPYEIVFVDIMHEGQKDPAFLKLCPNGKIPALVDHDAGGERIVIFESGAILQYLGRKSGKFYPLKEARRCWIDSWIFWQMSGLGPMSGQVTWFRRVAEVPGRDPRDSSYALHRFTREVKRLYAVLEGQLEGRDYICDDYSIADMACWPWIHQYHRYAGDIADYPNIKAWFERIGERPAVHRALALCTDGAQASTASGSLPPVKA